MLEVLFSKTEKYLPEKYRLILNHDGFKRYFKNTGWLFFGQMFSLLVSFFIAAWLARYLGPENFGVLSYAVAFVGLFGFISSLGVDGILNRDLVRFPEKRDELLGTAFRLKIIGGLIAVCLTVLAAFVFQTNTLIKLLITLFTIPFVLQSINVINIYFQAEVKSRNNVRTLIVATIISSILKIVVIIFNKGVIWLIIVYALDSLWQGLGLINAYRRYGLKIKNWLFDKNLAKEMLANSWPLMLASAAGFIYLKIDQVMIGSMMGSREVGLYAAAVKLVEVWYFIPVILCSSLFPAIINAKKVGEDFYKKRIKNFYLMMITIPVIIAIPVTFLAKPIIYILFGSGYLDSIIILQIYIWSSIGYFLGLAIYQYLMTEDRVKTIFITNLLAMAINVTLNFILIPRLGLIGAAVSTLISYFVIPVVVFAKPKNKLPL